MSKKCKNNKKFVINKRVVSDFAFEGQLANTTGGLFITGDLFTMGEKHPVQGYARDVLSDLNKKYGMKSIRMDAKLRG